jgi:acyl dehydratase
MSPAWTPGVAGLVGRQLAPLDWKWTQQETILYALGVGARLPRDLAALCGSEGEGVVVLPGFATVPTGIGVMLLVSELNLDVTKLLHAEHRVRLHRRLEQSGQAMVRRQITAVFDKGKHALITLEEHAVDDRGQPLVSSHSGWFLRDAGGFDGDRGPASAASTPEDLRPPDRTVRKATTPEQAVLYSLSGDRNPIHVESATARRAGHTTPILHGLCTLGIAALEVSAEMFDSDHGRIRELSGRFSAPVFPGDALILDMWRESDREAHFCARVRGRPVLVTGRLSV